MTSQINPTAINDQYPVAGQPNNTQGFRDNFAGTKTNFEYAADEITELQTKSILNAALDNGSALATQNNMLGAPLIGAKIRNFSADSVNIATTSGPIILDYSQGHYQRIATTGNITLGFTNFAASGSLSSMRVQTIIDTAGRTMALSPYVTLGTEGIQGYANGTITFAQAGTYQFGFTTSDSGATITIQDLNRPLSAYTNPVTIASTEPSSSITSGALVVAGGVGVAGNLYVDGNIVGNFVATTQTFAGNLTGGNLLTSGVVSATGNVSGGNVRTTGQVSATGNVTGAYIIGDGSQLTNITVSGGSSIVNGTSNVRAIANSNITIGIGGSNVAVWANTGGYVTGLISATGNVSAANLRTTGQVSATGNITGGNILAGSGVGVGGDVGVGGIIFANGNINTNTSFNALGNIVGDYFIGNGAFLSGLSSTSQITSGTTAMSVTTTSGNIQATIGGTANIAVISTQGINVTGNVVATANLGGLGVSVSGNVTGGNLRSNGLITAAGNITGGNIAGTGNVSTVGNVIAGNLTTGAQVVALGNVTGGNVATNGQVSSFNGTAIPAGGTAGAGYVFSSTANFGVFFGSGVPTLSAAKGSLYLRSDGSTTNDRMYVNTNGSTTWTAVITAS